MINLTINEQEKEVLIRALRIYAEEYHGVSNEVHSPLLQRQFAQDADRFTALADRFEKIFDITNLDVALKQLIRSNQFIEAIKMRRAHTNEGLKDAKDYCDKLRVQMGSDPSTS
jgi:ribosomal protein L7/L12